jgi:peptidoglycan/xylan/chitin deacetylase (PgdA/CDA1 family)
MPNNHGSFIISLDFELMWGVRDVATKASYGKNILGVHQVIPRLLQCFKKYDIHATFATVGFLFFKTKEELLLHLPENKPQYNNTALSPYGDYLMKEVGSDYTIDQYHFAPQLIELIQNTPHQEISTHTFSHYYCWEEGQTIDDFERDIIAAIQVASLKGCELKSIIFPRNQFNPNYVKVLNKYGINTYRSNERSWIYQYGKKGEDSLFKRLIRLINAYINLSGHHCYSDNEMYHEAEMIDIPSSRLLRPFSKKLAFLDGLRLRRIKKAMTHAAKNKLMFHLWWHPHNFGVNQDENFAFLQKILEHYKVLNLKYQFQSLNMIELADLLRQKNGK